jgi:hypothetical protein
MADRLDYYFRQKVTEAELDLGFELLEKADHNLAADIGIYGVVGGAIPAQHAPIADLTIDLSAPGRAYDRIGQRVFFGTGQTVNLAVDFTGIPTEVSSAKGERWLGVFLRFKRLLSDPRTDGNSQQVLFRRDESFELIVRQGPQGMIGTAPKVPLVDDELLLCDVRRRGGQLQILDTDISVSRRQVFVFAHGNAVQVLSGLWTAISAAAGTVQAALDSHRQALGETAWWRATGPRAEGGLGPLAAAHLRLRPARLPALRAPLAGHRGHQRARNHRPHPASRGLRAAHRAKGASACADNRSSRAAAELDPNWRLATRRVRACVTPGGGHAAPRCASRVRSEPFGADQTGAGPNSA